MLSNIIYCLAHSAVHIFICCYLLSPKQCSNVPPRRIVTKKAHDASWECQDACVVVAPLERREDHALFAVFDGKIWHSSDEHAFTHELASCPAASFDSSAACCSFSVPLPKAWHT